MDLLNEDFDAEQWVKDKINHKITHKIKHNQLFVMHRNQMCIKDTWKVLYGSSDIEPKGFFITTRRNK